MQLHFTPPIARAFKAHPMRTVVWCLILACAMTLLVWGQQEAEDGTAAGIRAL
jgi:hypothetical protein